MKRRWWVDIVQVFCPFCFNHYFGNVILSGKDVFGSKVTMYAVESNRPHARFMEKTYGSDLTPFSLVFEEKVFMNRRVWKPIFLAVGTFNEYMNYVFKKRFLNIEF